MCVVRKAIVTGGELATVQKYLPANYIARMEGDDLVVIGNDVCGWTLDGYVIPRLASGLIFAEEVGRDGETV